MAAGSQKEYELLFKLKAALGGDFKNTFKQANNAQKQLQNSLKNVNSIQSKVDGYTKQSAAIENNRKRLENLNTKHGEITKTIQTHKDNIARLKVAIKESGDAAGELAVRLQKEKDELAESRTALKSNESQIQQTNARIEEQEQALNNLGEELRDAGVDTGNLEGANARLQKSYEKLKSSQETLQNLNARQQDIQESIGKTKTQLLGTVGVMSAVAAAVYAGPIKTYQSFEEEMSTVAGITGATGEELEALKNAAKQAGQTTWATATESAQALEYMSLAGWSSEQSIGALNSMLQAAKISGLDLGASTDLVTDSMSAMGLSVDQLGHYLDVTVKANNVANTTSSDLMEAILGCAGAAKTNGMSLESLSTALSVFANNGLKGTQAGTAMNSILVRLTSNEKSLTETARLGVDVFDKETGEFRNMGDILKDLQAKMSNMTDAERDASLKAIAGTNYYSQFAYLLDSVSEAAEGTAGSWDALTVKLNDADGAAEAMYATMMDNFSGAMTEAKSAVEAVQLALGEALTPALTDIVRAVTPYIQKAATFISEHKEIVATVAKVAAGLAAARVGFLGLKIAGLSGESGIISIMKKLVGLRAGMIENAAAAASFGEKIKRIGSAFGGIAGKILPIVGIVTAVITVFKLVKDHLQEIRGFIQRTFGDEALAVFDRIVAVITSVGETIKNIFSDGNIGTARDKIQEIFGDKGAAVFDKLIPILKNVISAVQDIVGFITENVVPVAEDVLSVIAGQVIPGIVSFVKAAAPVIMEIMRSIADFIADMIPVIADAIAALMPVIQDIIGFISKNVLPVINEVFGFITSTVLPLISKMVQALLPVVKNVLETLIPAIKSSISVIWNAISPAINGIIEAIQFAMPVIQTMMGIMSDVIGGEISGLANALNGIINFIAGIFTGDWEKAWDGIKSFFSGIWEAIKSVVKGAWESIKIVLGPVKEWFAELWEKIKAPFAAAAEWFDQTVIQPIVRVFGPIVEKIGEIFAKLWEIVTVLFSIGAQWFNDNVVQPVIAVFSQVVETVSGFFKETWNKVTEVFSSVTEWFREKFEAAWEAVKLVFAPVGNFFTGIWNTIKEKFTSAGTAIGDTVSSAFKNVVNSILTFAESKINGFINGINTCIELINGIPGVSISKLTELEIPKLAKGSRNTPDTFIAGEAGPELITNAPGRTVFTAAQTKNIMAAHGAVREAAAPSAGGIGMQAAGTAPTVAAKAGVTNNERTNHVEIHNSPTIIVNGNQPGDLEAKLEENNRRLLRQVENLLYQKADKEVRQKYD